MMYELVCYEGVTDVDKGTIVKETVLDQGEDLDGLYEERDELDNLARKRHGIRPIIDNRRSRVAVV